MLKLNNDARNQLRSMIALRGYLNKKQLAKDMGYKSVAPLSYSLYGNISSEMIDKLTQILKIGFVAENGIVIKVYDAEAH